MYIMEEKEKLLKELEDLIDNSKIDNINKKDWYDWIELVKRTWTESYKQLIEGTIKIFREREAEYQELKKVM